MTLLLLIEAAAQPSVVPMLLPVPFTVILTLVRCNTSTLPFLLLKVTALLSPTLKRWTTRLTLPRPAPFPVAMLMKVGR